MRTILLSLDNILNLQSALDSFSEIKLYGGAHTCQEIKVDTKINIFVYVNSLIDNNIKK